MFDLEIADHDRGRLASRWVERFDRQRDVVAYLVALQVADGAASELGRSKEGGHDKAGFVDPEADVGIKAPPEVLDLPDEPFNAEPERLPGQVEQLARFGVG